MLFCLLNSMVHRKIGAQLCYYYHHHYHETARMVNMQTWLYSDIHVPIKGMKLSLIYLSVYEKSRLKYMNEIYLDL